MHRTWKAAVRPGPDPFRNRLPGKGASGITGGILLTLVVHGAPTAALLRSRTWGSITFLPLALCSGCSLRRVARTHTSRPS
jgi:hypothetical protein